MDAELDPGEGAAVVAAGRRSAGEPWRRVAGLVLFAYALVWGVALSLDTFSSSTFASSQKAMSNLVVRVLLAAVAVAAVHHLLDGVRRLLPPTSSVRRRADAVYAFGLWALGAPVVVLALWPAVRWWFA